MLSYWNYKASSTLATITVAEIEDGDYSSQTVTIVVSVDNVHLTQQKLNAPVKFCKLRNGRHKNALYTY